MIAKIIRGTRVQGLIRYLYGPGRHEEHHNPHIVAGFRDARVLESTRRPDGSRDFRHLDGLMTQPLALLGDRNHPRPVWHVPVRAAPEDPILSDRQWAEIATEIMHQSGLAPRDDPDAARWVAIRHGYDHIHIVATLARQDGTRPRVWNDAYRVRKACRDIEDRYKLRRTAAADRTAARRPTRGETEKAVRTGHAEPARTTLRRHVQTAAAGARTEAEFFTRLQFAGVHVRHRYSQEHPDELTGYAVALPSERTATGRPVWYGGGKLAADLTLPRLRHRWTTQPQPGPLPAYRPPVSGRHLSARTARAVLRTTVRQAADGARTAEEFFDRLTTAGLLLRLRHSKINPTQVTGYAVTLPDLDTEGAQPCWFSGGRLADDLTWPRLQRTWHNPTLHRPDERPQAMTPDERRAIYQDAARAASYATAQIRRHIAIDPQAARDACWAAADILRTAAQTTGNPHLNKAADAYDRAARPPHARLPPPTPAGTALRTIARILALLPATSGPTSSATALTTSLLVLLDTITQLHRNTPQATAVRSARTHLSGAITPSTQTPVPWLTESPHRTTPAALSMDDFPHAWRPDISPTETSRSPRSTPALRTRHTRAPATP